MLLFAFLPLVLAATFTRPMERVSSLDPAQARSLYDTHAVGLLYEMPLAIDYKARPYRVIPGFFELPDVPSDGLVYTLRRARPESDALTALDAARSLERLRDPKAVSPNGWILKDVGAISAPDAQTLVITLRRRCHFFPWLLTMPATAVCGPHGEGTGPYRLAAWRKNHEMVFARRGRGMPQGFDVVRHLVIDDASTQWLMFLKGELDFLGEVSRDNWDSVVGPDGRLAPALAAQGIRLHSIASLESLYVGINLRDPVLGPNRKLRQALNAAFDSAAWERFYNGRVLRGDGPVPPGVEGRLETPFPYAFDLAKARRLMSEAGYPDGRDSQTGRRLVLTLSVGRASQESREAAELMAAFYERIGIRLECDFKTWDAFLRATAEGRVQLFRMGWVGDYPDAQNFLQLFYSKNRAPGPNRAAYASEAFDRAYEAALAAPTADERNAHWATCQEIVREDCPWIFLHFPKAYSLSWDHVGNYIPSDFPYGTEKHYFHK